jgi:hypothetical protein
MTHPSQPSWFNQKDCSVTRTDWEALHSSLDCKRKSRYGIVMCSLFCCRLYLPLTVKSLWWQHCSRLYATRSVLRKFASSKNYIFLWNFESSASQSVRGKQVALLFIVVLGPLVEVQLQPLFGTGWKRMISVMARRFRTGETALGSHPTGGVNFKTSSIICTGDGSENTWGKQTQCNKMLQ